MTNTVSYDFIRAINSKMNEKSLTVKNVVDNSQLDIDTITSYLTHRNKLSYSNACVLYDVVVNDRVFSSVEELNLFREYCVKLFYTKFKVKLGSLTYLAAEDIYGISHSTLHTYVKESKKPKLENSYKLSKVMEIPLMFDFSSFINKNNEGAKLWNTQDM